MVLVVYPSISNETKDQIDLFPNDVSSANEVTRARRAAEQALLDAQNVDAANARKEAERKAQEALLQRRLDEANALVLKLEDENSTLEAEIKTTKTKSEEERKLHNEALKKQEELAKSAMQQLDDKISATLDTDNDLPLTFHGKTVNIVNSCSKTALDFGKTNGTYMHGHQHKWENDWQHLVLEKTDPSDPRSNWLISAAYSGDKRYLTFDGSDAFGDFWPECLVRRWEDRKTTQEWRIGSTDAGKWMLKNVSWGTYLWLQEEEEFKNGGRYMLHRQEKSWSSQNFFILHHFRGSYC